MKKKDKFKTVGQELKLRNITINDLEDIHDFQTSKKSTTKPVKKPLDKGEISLKANMKLVKSKVIEIMANNTYRVQLHESGENNQSSKDSIINIKAQKNSILESQEKSIKTCFLSGRLKYLDHVTRNPISIGDIVNVDVTDLENIRIEEIYERKNSISRYIERTKKEVTLASNIDQVVIVASVKDPDLNTGLIDRYICALEIANISCIICINKIDLVSNLDFIKNECEYYKSSGYDIVFLSTLNNKGISELREMLVNKETVFTGHSGTGKSSIINTLEPTINLKVSQTSLLNKKGIHTTSYSRMIPWGFGGFLIDTPGIKTMGLRKEDKTRLPACFPGFLAFSRYCSFANCSHTQETGCAVIKNVGTAIPIERYNSYVRILKSVSR